MCVFVFVCGRGGVPPGEGGSATNGQQTGFVLHAPRPRMAVVVSLYMQLVTHHALQSTRPTPTTARSIALQPHTGDTRPCPALIAAGADATLLIHESTFEGGMGSHAIAKQHSTLQEALEVAEKMRAYR